VGTRIVIAAGRSTLRAALDRALTAAGFEVTARCGTAHAAVEAVTRDHPDVCIVDSNLPGGALVAAAAIALPPSRPAVLVIDPEGSDAALRAAELAGASGYLRGELDDVRLTDAVAALSKRRHTRR
jgi:DNA-binding NarL/FixJ family response regulator